MHDMEVIKRSPTDYLPLLFILAITHPPPGYIIILTYNRSAGLFTRISVVETVVSEKCSWVVDID